MMTSRVLSRFLPVAEGDQSVFETRRVIDLESNRPARSEDPFHDYEDNPEQLFFEGANDDASNPANLSPEDLPSSRSSPALERVRPRWPDNKRDRGVEEDDDVPESLLLDTKNQPPDSRSSSQPAYNNAQARTEAQWRTTQERQRMYGGPSARQTNGPQALPGSVPSGQPDPRAEAMWLYTNAHNLDAFLLEVYQYYVEHGVWSMLLSRAISLLTELFVFSFAMFLSTCIDYSKVPLSKSTSEVLIPKCFTKASWTKSAALFFFTMYWLTRLTQLFTGVRRLFRMHDFFLHVLNISDHDIQTISWAQVVDGLVRIQNANIATANPSARTRKFLDYSQPQQRLSAEAIANRLMRQANYYVAMYNKDVFDFTLPLPFVGSRQFYSKSLEWCIDFCLTNFIFDEQGSIRPFCLEVKNRSALVAALQTRLQFAAITSVIIAPFNILRFCIMYFFRYYTEFTKNPAKISARSFTPFAEWKIRDFNELNHLFERRLRLAYPFANEYLKQFPKDKTDQACRFIALVSGAIAAVLGILTLWDSELFLPFELTPGRSVLFWLAMMGGIFGVAHGSLPDENEVHEPVFHLKAVLAYTHYMPAHWKTRLHSNEVRSEFSALYQMKVVIFLEEILSLIVAPWILLRNASSRSARIIDFFREQTVHVDGIGYQCNFAVFGFKKDLNAEDPTAVLNEPDGLRDDYFGLKDDKLAVSVQNFRHFYGPMKRNLHQLHQHPPHWPAVLAQNAIAEESDAVEPATKPIIASRAASNMRPGLSESRRQRSPMALRSPRQAALVQSAIGRRMGREQSHDRSGNHMNNTISESRLLAQDSDVYDYVAGAGKDKFDSDSDNDDDNEDAGKDAGVLGMIKQFSKAQTEKGVGGNI